MVVYCSECWSENQYGESKCRSCGASLIPVSEENYVTKLIKALRHPEPSTPIRAAWILGNRKEIQAVPQLLILLQSSSDPYILSSVVNALGQIGDSSVIDTLEQLLDTTFLKVRLEIIKALRNIGGPRARDILQCCLKSDNQKIRESAHIALQQLSSKQ
jgi:HEAT repeat protein